MDPITLGFILVVSIIGGEVAAIHLGRKQVIDEEEACGIVGYTTDGTTVTCKLPFGPVACHKIGG